MESEHYRKLERMYGHAPINDLFDPILSVGEGEATVEMEIEPRHFHTAGAAHGCVAFKALDDAAFFAVQSLLSDHFVTTASFQIYMVRPMSLGPVKAEGRVVHSSKRLFIAESVMRDAAGKLLARGSGTFMQSKVAMTDGDGYA